MKVSLQLHAPAAFPPGRETPLPIGEEGGWVTAGLDSVL